MKQITFNNGNQMPMLGLGTFRVSDGETLVQSVKHAIEVGYRSIDTAMIYDNESSVGQGIKEGLASTGLNREDLFITSKLWLTDFGKENVEKAYLTTLEKLQLEYLDLYLMHWPGTDEALFIETWQALETLYEAGKIKNIGVSNFTEAQLEALLKVAKVKPVINQVEYHPVLTQQSLKSYLKNQDIVMESWSPLMNGEILKNDTIIEIANKYKKSPAQIIIRWNIDTDVVVIPKSVTTSRIEENIEVFDFELTKEDIEVINALNEDRRIGPDPTEFDGK